MTILQTLSLLLLILSSFMAGYTLGVWKVERLAMKEIDKMLKED